MSKIIFHIDLSRLTNTSPVRNLINAKMVDFLVFVSSEGNIFSSFERSRDRIPENQADFW
jgi:hypothetical protein